MAYRDNKRRVPHDNNRASVFTVREEMPLLQAVMTLLDGISRNKAKSLLSHGAVSVDGRVATNVNTVVPAGASVTISRGKRSAAELSPHYNIVYEDRWLVVVDKAEGVLSMPVGAHSLNMKSLLDRYFALKGQRCTAHVVHRLDCRTSGLMMYAKSVDVQQQLQDNWHERVFDRRYVAVVEGVMEQDDGVVESYLRDTRSMTVVSTPVEVPGSRFASTSWHVLERGEDRTLVELRLSTGRKNQIRVHMADIGHPVVGDGKYGTQHDPGSRLCLHACVLAFTHPVTGEQLAFDTPIPTYFYNQLDASSD